MRSSARDAVAGAAELVFDLFGTLILTAAGIESEFYGAHVLGTDTQMALWFVYMGAIALYAGVVVFGKNRLLPRFGVETAS